MPFTSYCLTGILSKGEAMVLWGFGQYELYQLFNQSYSEVVLRSAHIAGHCDILRNVRSVTAVTLMAHQNSARHEAS